MRRVVWILAWIGVALWSAASLGAYALVDLFGDIAYRHADVVSTDPETVVWVAWAVDLVRDLGLGALVVLWVVVALLILGVAWIITRFIGEAADRRPDHPPPAR